MADAQTPSPLAYEVNALLTTCKLASDEAEDGPDQLAAINFTLGVALRMMGGVIDACESLERKLDQ